MYRNKTHDKNNTRREEKWYSNVLKTLPCPWTGNTNLRQIVTIWDSCSSLEQGSASSFSKGP